MAHLMRIYHRPQSDCTTEAVVGIELNGPSIVKGFSDNRQSDLNITKGLPAHAPAEEFNNLIHSLENEGFSFIGRFYVDSSGKVDWSENRDQPQTQQTAESKAVFPLFTSGVCPDNWSELVGDLFKGSPTFQVSVANDRTSAVIHVLDGSTSDVLRVEHGLFGNDLITRVEGGIVRSPFTQVAVLAIGLRMHRAATTPDDNWGITFQQGNDDVPVGRAHVRSSHQMFEGFDLNASGGFSAVIAVAEELGVLPKAPKLKVNALQFGAIFRVGSPH